MHFLGNLSGLNYTERFPRTRSYYLIHFQRKNLVRKSDQILAIFHEGIQADLT